uniref:BHLH domain-containing protein n=1 Tax=Timema shepardi TaxID=629360 RepID=A0A7R9ATP3_TIMSH|nr:unnamed protein product [Timema shepardi]
MKAITATVCTASTGTGVANGRIHRPRRDVENEEIQLYLSKLKELVPFMPKNRKLSKLEVIQYVIDYICDLQYALETHPTVATAVNSAVTASSLPVTTARHSGSCQQRQPLVVLAPNTILPCSSQDVAATLVVVLTSSVPCGHLCWLSWLVCRLSILTERGPTVVTKIPGTAASFLDCATSLPPHDMLSKNTRSLVCAGRTMGTFQTQTAGLGFVLKGREGCINSVMCALHSSPLGGLINKQQQHGAVPTPCRSDWDSSEVVDASEHLACLRTTARNASQLGKDSATRQPASVLLDIPYPPIIPHPHVYIFRRGVVPLNSLHGLLNVRLCRSHNDRVVGVNSSHSNKLHSLSPWYYKDHACLVIVHAKDRINISIAGLE